MAISTFKTFLMKKASDSTTWSKLIDIKEFPDLGGEPEMLETTTLSDNMQTYIAGIQSLDGLSFTANYTLADFQTLKALEGKNRRVMQSGSAAPRAMAPLPPMALTASSALTVSCPGTPWAAA